MVLYKLNDAFSAADGVDAPGFGARFDVRVTQALPFMNFRTSQWEMLVGVRNLFHDSLDHGSIYDELLVVRPPKRLVAVSPSSSRPTLALRNRIALSLPNRILKIGSVDRAIGFKGPGDNRRQ